MITIGFHKTGYKVVEKTRAIMRDISNFFGFDDA